MSSIKKSFNILHSSLILVLTTYIIDVIFARLAYLNLKIIAISFIVPLKIFVYSGVYGMLTEIVGGEEIILKFNRFQTNAKKYWKHYLLILTIPFVLHFTLTIFNLNIIQISLFSFFSLINPLILIMFILTLTQNKYLKPLKLKKKKTSFSPSAILIFFVMCSVNIFILYLPHIFQFSNFELSRITNFLHHYLNFLIFIYFSCLILKHYPEIQKNFTSSKEIYLINPLGGGLIFNIGSMFIRAYPPIFVVLKALTPKNYKFREFNRVPWKDHYCASDKLIAITCFSSNSIEAYHIAKKFKENGSKVIIGGPHVTYLPKEALEYCDSVVCGEVESVWPDVIKDYENNSLKKQYIGEPLENCHELIHQELLNSPPEIIKDFLETSRGCKFKCHFCTVPSLSQGKLRKSKIPNFIELIKKVKTKYNHVLFIDNNIYSDPSYAKELFTALKPIKIHWTTQCSIDIAKNKKLLKLAKESGCKSLLIGFEISEGSFEKKQGGKLAMVDHYQEYAKNIQKIGIHIKAHFIFGFESDKLRSLYKFWKFCFAIKPTFTVFSILTPFPGSKFYYNVLQQDRITNLNWARYGGQTLVFNHPRINNFILSKLFPIFYVFFLLTTSKFGYILLFFIILNMLRIRHW